MLCETLQRNRGRAVFKIDQSAAHSQYNYKM